MAVQSVGSDTVVMLILGAYYDGILSYVTRQGRGKIHVADTWLYLQIIILFLIICYKFFIV